MKALPFAALALVLAAGCSNTQATANAPQEAPGPVPGAGVKVVFSDHPVPMPAMTLTDVATGQPIDQSAWRGKVVVLNFWATWCGPCRMEIPDLIKLQERYRDKLVVVGLSVDEVSADIVHAFAVAQNINYPIAIVDDQTEKLFGGVTSIPSTFIVNPEGGIVQRHVGLLRADVTEQEVRALAHLPTQAEVSIIPDTGQVLKANAAYATEIPGISFEGMTVGQKAEALKRLNEEMCTCGCGSTLAGCRIEDPACETSLPLAKKLVAEIKKKR
jgi:cytochrome c biogenesis protein CcmG/thiol:disulfide interchange protein DsbE